MNKVNNEGYVAKALVPKAVDRMSKELLAKKFYHSTSPPKFKQPVAEQAHILALVEGPKMPKTNAFCKPDNYS